MVRNPLASEDGPTLQSVLDALDDEDCREIVKVLGEPKTASEIASDSDVPLSTCYRKIELLTEASLLAEGVKVQSDGQHASQYAIDFEEVIVMLDEDRELDIEIAHRSRSADQRLANIWSEVSKET